MLEHSVIKPMLERLDEDDQRWSETAFQIGYQYITCSVGSEDRNLKVMSVFDSLLPLQLRSNPEMNALWARRQQWERSLKHPDFAHVLSREYVMNRLESFMRMGLNKEFKPHMRDGASGITDEHIVENLLIKHLDEDTGGLFSEKYLFAESKVPKVQTLLEYYGIVKPKSIYLKPIIHPENIDFATYEVITTHTTFRLNTAVEAFALFFLLKQQQGSLSEFPETIQQAVGN